MKTWNGAAALYLLLGVGSGFGLLGKLPLLQKILPLPHIVWIGVVLIWIFAPLAYARALRVRTPGAVLVLVGVLISALLMFPRMSALQKTGRGTDQPDCVIVAAREMAKLDWPYNRAKLWTHNPMSCGPSWVLLQTPVILGLGYRWNLVALWAIATALFILSCGWKATAGFLTLMGLSVSTWVAASDGTDFITFGVLFAAIIAAQQSRFAERLLPIALFAMIIGFRFPMFVLPVLVLPPAKLRQGIWMSLSAIAIHLAFLLWNPSSYVSDGPLHLFYKLTRSHVLASGRLTAPAEILVISLVILVVASYLRMRFRSQPLAIAYFLILIGIPASTDLLGKIREFRSVPFAVGIWEGPNWLTACVALSAVLLLQRRGDLVRPNSKIAWPYPDEMTADRRMP